MDMKKYPLQDIAIIALLVLLLFAWGPIYHKFLSREPAPATVQPGSQLVEPAATNAAPTSGPRETPAIANPSAPAIEPTQTVAKAIEPPSRPLKPQQRVTISNEVARVTFSSWGGGIVMAEFGKYRRTVKADSGPAVLDFSDAPALSCVGIPGLSTNDDFDLAPDPDGRSLRIEKKTPAGLKLVRTVSLESDYRLRVKDELSSDAKEPLAVPRHGWQIGPMRAGAAQSASRGYQSLGIDALPAGGGEPVRQWARGRFMSKNLTLPLLFQEEERRGGCMKPRMKKPLPVAIEERVNTDADWVAVKDKFFVQILAADPAAAGYALHAARYTYNEDPSNPRTWAGSAVLREVSAVVRAEEKALAPGETVTQTLDYYIGPKEYETIRRLGNHRHEIMEFGMLDLFCRVTLLSLNWFHRVIPYYGIAIILLTLVMRVIFWPLTHKSTESMKKMQELQPEVTALREKHKDNPQKLHQETMALYKQHKVSPLGGCLPMVVQIPVFISLFIVLRSAVELRFAAFLWIPDLSDQEGLLRDVLPLPLNILPLLMGATWLWQQKLTPSTGDPAQQKMMMLMPLVMTVMLYSMPSALILYWTVNQCLMIVQLLWQKQKTAAKSA